MHSTNATPRVIHEDVTDTAKRLRRTLRDRFPDVKFSVRTSRFSQGTSIDVGWTDGPSQPAVQAITDPFRSSWFDGMTDTSQMLDPVLVANEDTTYEVICSGARFVEASRQFTPQARAAAAAEIEAAAGAEAGSFNADGLYRVHVWDLDEPAVAVADEAASEYGHTLVWRLLRNRDLRGGATA